MDDKLEMYSYIVSSIDILNKSVKLQEQGQVRLFTYLYNNQQRMYDEYAKMDERITKIEGRLDEYNKKIKDIVKKQRAISNRIDEICKREPDDKVEEDIHTDSKPIASKFSFIANAKDWVKMIIEKAYKMLFRKKIERIEMENNQKAIEAKKKEDEKKKQIIKDILNNAGK